MSVRLYKIWRSLRFQRNISSQKVKVGAGGGGGGGWKCCFLQVLPGICFALGCVRGWVLTPNQGRLKIGLSHLDTSYKIWLLFLMSNAIKKHFLTCVGLLRSGGLATLGQSPMVERGSSSSALRVENVLHGHFSSAQCACAGAWQEEAGRVCVRSVLVLNVFVCVGCFFLCTCKSTVFHSIRQ